MGAYETEIGNCGSKKVDFFRKSYWKGNISFLKTKQKNLINSRLDTLERICE